MTSVEMLNSVAYLLCFDVSVCNTSLSTGGQGYVRLHVLFRVALSSTTNAIGSLALQLFCVHGA